MSITTNSRAARWKIRQRQHELLIDHLCAVRSIAPEELEFDFERSSHDPKLLPDMDKACWLFEEAVTKKWKIGIFGDYDADGTPGAALLVLLCRRFGLEHCAVLPTRETGYGLRAEDVRRFAEDCQLLITVDTGITAVAEIKLAVELGLKVIVLDHHLPAEELPVATALVDPYIDGSRYPFSHLCGCAVAYKFITALSHAYPEKITEAFRKWLLDLVAISTVSDMMVMRGENRMLVHFGLKVLQKNKRIGLRALLRGAGLEPDQITAETIGYGIGPRLNAFGRLGDNTIVLDLLLTDDERTAEVLASKIEQANRERQQLVEELAKEIDRVLFVQNKRDDPFFVVSGEDWPTGILGLAAGRVSAAYNRPAVVLAKVDDQFVGSGRSPETYSLIDGLTAQKKFLKRFGGHRTAAGLSVHAGKLEQFISGLKAHAALLLSAEDMVPIHVADAELSEAELSLATARQIRKLEPFGFQNPPPLFLIRNVTLSSVRYIGRQNNHLKATASSGAARFDVIGFNLAKQHGLHNEPKLVDCLGCLEENVWNGRRTLQLRVVDCHPAGKPVEMV